MTAERMANVKNPNGILGTISFLVPLIGFIIGIVFVVKAGFEDKRTGKICLVASLVGLVVGVVFIAGCPMLLLGSLSGVDQGLGNALRPVEQLVPQEPISLSGYGQQATGRITLSRGLRIFRFTYTDSSMYGSNFSTALLDENGNYVDLVVNEVVNRGATHSGSKATRITRTGNYVLDVSADGSWAIEIE